MKTEISATFLIFTFLTIGFGNLLVSAGSLTNQTVELYGEVISNPNYTVWTKNQVFYANSTQGIVAYSNPVASKVLDYVTNSLKTGGCIFVKDGIYFTDKWTINQPNIQVIGESWNTTFTIANNFNDAVIAILANNVTIRNIQVDGNLAGQNSNGDGHAFGIIDYGGSYCKIQNCYVTQTRAEGINICNGAAYCLVSECTVENTYITGIVFYGKTGTTTLTNTRWNTLSDCVFRNNGIRGGIGNNAFFSGVDYCVARNLFCDTASDCNFEIQGGGVSNIASHGREAKNLTCLNSSTVAIYLDGSADGLYHCFDPKIYDFYINNSRINGVGISAYVDNPVVYDGNIQGSSGIGLSLWNYILGGSFNNISIQITSGTGAKIFGTGCINNTLTNNRFISCPTSIIDLGSNTIISNNTGYNPVGIITYPFIDGNHILFDSGGNNSTWSSNITYTNWESPKTLYISNGIVAKVIKNGQTIFSSSNCTVILQPSDTFSIVFSQAPTIKVQGQ